MTMNCSIILWEKWLRDHLTNNNNNPFARTVFCFCFYLRRIHLCVHTKTFKPIRALNSFNKSNTDFILGKVLFGRSNKANEKKYEKMNEYHSFIQWKWTNGSPIHSFWNEKRKKDTQKLYIICYTMKCILKFHCSMDLF